ncbi:serine/threonine-protein kinase [Sphaerisporangium flaviroseum]|uniref:serine/threonine protein kinase n=1 Tax=Sphaerisporangium flaviroseum TaxID=509199 RepID=UPI0031E80373
MEALYPGDPAVIGPYRIAGRLGSGGMGVVYAGVDGYGVRAAVKLIQAAYAGDPEFRARFGREINLVSRVQGVCTAKVLAADPAAPQPWLATEYVQGPTLDQFVATQGSVEGAELRSLAAGLAEALVAIHAAGVVHRDLKPTNVILGPGGPRVVDFGIARTLDATAITRSGMVIGSPGWISPEEYYDQPITPAVDVYGWGLLVTYAASGKAPFGPGRPEVLALRTLHESVDTQAVPDQLRPLVDRALAKDPDQRPSALEVLAAVIEEPGQRPYRTVTITSLLDRTWAGRIPPEAPWPSVTDPPHPNAARRRYLAVAGTATAIVLSVFGIATVAASSGAKEPQGREDKAGASAVAMSTAPTPSTTISPTPPTISPSPVSDRTSTPSSTPTPTPTPTVSVGPTRTPKPRTVHFASERGIEAELPIGWEASGSADVYCILPPFTLGISRANCLGGLEISRGNEYDPTSESFGWDQSNAVCNLASQAFKPPNDAWRYDGLTRPGPKLLLHNYVSVGGHRASHARWKYSCYYRTMISEIWYVPDLKVVFFADGITDKHRSAYLKIMSSVDFSRLVKLLRKPTLEETN